MTTPDHRAALEEAIACIEALRPFPLVMDGVVKGKLQSWQKTLATPPAPSAEVRDTQFDCPACGNDLTVGGHKSDCEFIAWLENGKRPSKAISDPLDAIEAQLREMRSLKGWRLNLIRENLQKLRTALSSGLVAPAQEGWNEIINAAQFLADRLDEFDPGEDEAEREYHGHVAPALARLKTALHRGAKESDGSASRTSLPVASDQIAEVNAPHDPSDPTQETVTDFVLEHYANQDMNHVDFRVEAYRRALAEQEEKNG